MGGSGQFRGFRVFEFTVLGSWEITLTMEDHMENKMGHKLETGFRDLGLSQKGEPL